MSEAFLIWLVGFFEGEGSIAINIHKKTKTGTIFLYVYQKHLSVLEDIQRQAGGRGRVKNVKMNAAGRMCGRWVICGSQARALLQMMRPYMRTPAKIKKAEEVLASKP